PASVSTWFSVPLGDLVRPRIPPTPGGDLRSRLWPVVSSPYVDPSNAGTLIRDEILGRWALQNAIVLSRQVTIRLTDPSELPSSFGFFGQGPGGAQPSAQHVLEFTVEGQTMVELGSRVHSEDGSVSPIA